MACTRRILHPPPTIMLLLTLAVLPVISALIPGEDSCYCFWILHLCQSINFSYFCNVPFCSGASSLTHCIYCIIISICIVQREWHNLLRTSSPRWHNVSIIIAHSVLVTTLTLPCARRQSMHVKDGMTQGRCTSASWCGATCLARLVTSITNIYNWQCLIWYF